MKEISGEVDKCYIQERVLRMPSGSTLIANIKWVDGQESRLSSHWFRTGRKVQLGE